MSKRMTGFAALLLIPMLFVYFGGFALKMGAILDDCADGNYDYVFRNAL
jgi:hypothetical protein